MPASSVASVNIEYPEFLNLKAKTVTYTATELEILMLERSAPNKTNATAITWGYDANYIIDVDNAIAITVNPSGSGTFNVILDR
jgi:capsule polysaccharide export protein KpsC/LpsZ